MENPIVALLSDFGTKDSYAGVIKGVLLSICPKLRIIDITHEVAPQNVRQAAFILANSYKFFPKGTIFIAVVDPGVGSNRKAIVANINDYFFVVPDNGLLTFVAENESDFVAHEISNSNFMLKDVSNTFHGRDIFAPVAANIANSISLDKFGEPFLKEELTLCEKLLCDYQNNEISAEIIGLDRFGNLTTTLSRKFVAENNIKLEHPTIYIADKIIYGIKRMFSEADEGEALAYFGSDDYLEIAIRNGNAAKKYGISLNSKTRLSIIPG